MKKMLEMAVLGGVTGGGMGLSRLHNDPDGWAQVALGVVLFAAFGALVSLIVQLAQAWRRAARRRSLP